ncbi:MAG: M14 family metallopeptidase [Gemmatimonadaceae bacterium]
MITHARVLHRASSLVGLGLMSMLSGCAASSSGASSGDASGRTMPPNCCLEAGLDIAERYRASGIADRRFDRETLSRALASALRSPAILSEEIGRSIHGRPIHAMTFGEGATSVLLWSQMHGDESTATMALVDILLFLASADDDPLRERLRSSLTITMVPMLNPDGAELFQRENAMGIDINRDARRLATPEARALKSLRDRLEPDFGFNLHDQGARTLAGEGGRQVAIALLAPAFDAERSYNDTRSRARLVAARIAEVLRSEIPGQVARYDDTFNPRAFGDLIQQWGTSTVLIESGAIEGDPEKQRLRALNVAAILTALDAIGTGSYARADPDEYDRLPFNERISADLLITGASIVLDDGDPIRADLALTYDDAVARTGPRLRDVGDLTEVVALDTIQAAGLFVHPAREMLTVREGKRWLQIDEPAELEIRRGALAGSELVRRIGGK